MKKSLTTTVAVALLSLTGCAAETGPEIEETTAAVEEVTEAEPAELGEVASLEELRTAYESAVTGCTTWQSDDSANGITLGVCNGTTVLGVYDTSDDMATGLDMYSRIDSLQDSTRELLIGENWIIAGVGALLAESDLGGQLTWSNGER